MIPNTSSGSDNTIARKSCAILLEPTIISDIYSPSSSTSFSDRVRPMYRLLSSSSQNPIGARERSRRTALNHIEWVRTTEERHPSHVAGKRQGFALQQFSSKSSSFPPIAMQCAQSAYPNIRDAKFRARLCHRENARNRNPLSMAIQM